MLLFPEESKFRDISVSSSYSSIIKLKDKIEGHLNSKEWMSCNLNSKYGEVMIADTMAEIFKTWIAKDEKYK
jgi:hypothetical protein